MATVSIIAWRAISQGARDEANVQFDRISIDPGICHGQACVKGTRLPVHQIVRMLANGETVEGFLSEYPYLSREDIAASLDYAASLAEEQVTPTFRGWPLPIGASPDPELWEMALRRMPRINHNGQRLRGVPVRAALRNSCRTPSPTEPWEDPRSVMKAHRRLPEEEWRTLFVVIRDTTMSMLGTGGGPS